MESFRKPSATDLSARERFREFAKLKAESNHDPSTLQPELKESFGKAVRAYAYIQSLSELKVRDSFFREAEVLRWNFSLLGAWSRLKKLPREYRALLEASAVGIVAFSIVLFFPWTWLFQQFKGDDSFVIAEYKVRAPEVQQPTGVAEKLPAEQIQSDIGIGIKNSKTVRTQTSVATGEVKEISNQVTASKAASTVAEPTDLKETVKSKTTKGNAFVYRLYMFLPDPDGVSDEMVQILKELGAKKAGQVELGWQQKNGRYFHFSMPKANDSPLIEKLKEFGPIRIQKDDHPRVMPETLYRYILWVEASK